MIVNGFCKEVFREPSMELVIDALRDVANGVNALKSPERATLPGHDSAGPWMAAAGA